MKSILFKPDMIKAIIEGRKTQTRRVIKWALDADKPYKMTSFARYQVGEVIYIKEVWRFVSKELADSLDYDFGIEFSDGKVLWWTDNGNEMNYPLDEKKRSPMFLPEKFARSFIQITSIRAERLQSITPEDCKAEGSYMATNKDDECGYVNLWNSINPKYPWSSNPWVWRYEFKKVGKCQPMNRTS